MNGNFRLFTMGNNQLNDMAFQAFPQDAAVVAAVGHVSQRFLLWSAMAGPADGYSDERGFCDLRLGAIGRRQVHSERNTLCVSKFQKLGTLTIAVLPMHAPLFSRERRFHT